MMIVSVRALPSNDWALTYQGCAIIYDALYSDVITTRKDILSERAQEIYEFYLCEKELAPGDRPMVAPLTGLAETGDFADGLKLKTLEDLRNVNAIVPGQRIEFNPRMTIIFGENAAGKTGYVRVLKRVAAVRTAEEILPNIMSGAGPTTTPQATLTYEFGGSEQRVEWKNEAGVSPFNRMDVFDAHSAAVHLDEELTYVYTPGELALFPMIQQGIEQTQRLLDVDIKAKATTSNPYTTLFDRRSRIYPKIESLGAATDLRELRELARISTEDEERSVSLRIELDALRSSSPQAPLALVENRIRVLNVFVPAFRVVEEFDYGRYLEAREEQRIAEQRHEESTRLAFSGLPIPGLLGDEWRRFIEAGEEYVHAIDKANYPSADDSCIYCRQPLPAEAIALLRKYREYCSNAARVALEDARRVLERVTQPIEVVALATLKEKAEECERDPVAQKLRLKLALETIEDGREAILARREFSWNDIVAIGSETRDHIEKEISESTILVEQLRAEAKNRGEALKEREVVLMDLDARRLLARHLPAIEKYISDAQWVDKARAQAKRFSVTLKSLTDTAKIASDRLLNQDFGRRFEEESERLRAPKVRLEFPGRQGQVVRRKAVVTGHRPSESLSEGEQKVIALADFLAEVNLKGSRSPVVFDDPITSLDYKRMIEVAKRIVELSKDQQTIVFTHNIWFATELLSHFEESPGECAYYDIRSDGESFGLVSKGSHPRADTFKTDRARINELIQHAKKATGSVQDALIEKGYEYLRNVCEVIVETDLLQGVTQRYQPNVMMTKLPHIKVERLKAAVYGIMPIFEKACRLIASHSQPMETLNVRPSLADLESDWKAVQDLRDTYVKD